MIHFVRLYPQIFKFVGIFKTYEIMFSFLKVMEPGLKVYLA